ncbi:peroxiredoxin family protein [Owenweeksia hongkongensis]|uniref:peroxiredoxin family protein n=1 Tax=Owenweeksia hongkongensis TaxID=253245 RepID=UPI003A94B7FF
MKTIKHLTLAAILVTTLPALAQSENEMEKDSKTLTETLNERKENFNAKAPADKKKDYAEGIKAVEESGVLEAAINVGDKAPNFKLNNAVGKKVSLHEELKNGPVVLVWYRGGWCPYCNITLHYLQENMDEFKARGANLLALTPENPDKSMNTTEKNELEFQVLSDLDNKVAKEYGIVFKLTPAVAARYEEGFGLSEYNGNDKGELPLAATYVINTDGKVTYSFLHADYRERAPIEDIIQALDELKKD